MNEDHVTQFKWKIENFGEFHWSSTDTKSCRFELEGLSIVKFRLFYDRSGEPWQSSFGVVMEAPTTAMSLRVHIKFWLETHSGKRTPGWTVEMHKFRNAGEKRSFTARDGGYDPDRFELRSADRDVSLSFCCEIKLITPTCYVQMPCQVHRNLWDYHKGKDSKRVMVKVGNHKFKVIQAFLTSQCDVFKDVLSTTCMKEKIEEIEVNGFDTGTIEAFVAWLYFGTVKSESLLESLYLLAETYSIQDLKKQCFDLIKFTLSDKNVMERLVLSIKFENKALKDLAFNFLATKNETGRIRLIMSIPWCLFVTENEESAAQVMKEFYVKREPE